MSGADIPADSPEIPENKIPSSPGAEIGLGEMEAWLRGNPEDLLIAEPESPVSDAGEKIVPVTAAKPLPRSRNRSRRQQDRARRRQKNYLELRREQKRRMVFYSRVRLCFKLCFAILWAVLLWELLHSPLWTFRQPYYRVHSHQLVRAGDLKPMVASWVGKPIYEVDTGKMAEEIERRYAIVDKASVRRRMFPTKLEITIHEKQPWGEIYGDEKQTRPYALLVPDDIVSLAGYRYGPGLYPDLQLEKILLSPGTRYQKATLDKLREVAWQARQIKGLNLVSVDARNMELVRLNFRETVVLLGRLNASTTERLSRLVPLVPKIHELRKGLESVDLRWEEQVTVHTKPNVQLFKPAPETDG